MTQPAEQDREIAALQAILDALLPRIQAGLLYYQVWAYRVISSDAGPPVTVSAKSQDPRMPDLSKIVLRQGPDGGYATPAGGSLIGVAFLNADPSMPYVHSLDPTSTPSKSWQHAGSLVELGDGSAAAIAHSQEVLAVHSAITTFTLAVQTVLAQMVLGYSSLTAGQITAWNNAVAAIGNAITLQALTLPTTKVKGT